MKIKIGIMQGRLSDKLSQPLQSFPWADWQKEFERAHSLGFNQIEWLIDGNNDSNNPIATLCGQKEIMELLTTEEINKLFNLEKIMININKIYKRLELEI